MENVVLVIHLILALCLIGIVLMQRSEGGGLGIGGGSGGGLVSARGAATALSKITWALAAAFICTSIGLTIIAAEKSAGASVVDRLIDAAPVEAPSAETGNALGSDLLPPSADSDAPLLPSGN